MTRRPNASNQTPGRRTEPPGRRAEPPWHAPRAGALGRGPWLIPLALAVVLGATGCSDTLESIARPFDPAAPAEPDKVSTGTDPEQETYPNLSEVPEAPPRRPSGRDTRQGMRDSLASDRDQARYSDERLRGQGTGGTEPSGAPDRADVAMPDDDAGSGDLRDGESISVDDRGRTQRSGDGDRRGSGAAAGERSAGDGGERAGDRSTASDRSGRSADGAAGGAERPARGDIPQIQPSQQGEPIQLPDMPDAARQGDSSASGAQPAPRRGQQAQAPRDVPSATMGRSRTFAQGDPGRTAGQAAGQRVAVIYFAHGSASLNGRDRQVLRRVAELARSRNARLRVVGHSSSRTAPMDLVEHRMANFDTSMQRAEAVADTLVSMGVARGRIQVEARADRAPVYHEFMPTGEAGNRRTEIFLQG